jgi:high-affinity Fe2+/Pb2+ permease
MPGQASRVLVAQSGGGGAELNEVIGLTAVAVAVSFVLLGIGYLHRTQRITWLTSLADRTGRRFKRPSWEALPLVVLIATTNIALFGFIWDVSLHIGKGRDPGPLANPAHYFILVGLALVFLAGALIVVIRSASLALRPCASLDTGTPPSAA